MNFYLLQYKSVRGNSGEKKNIFSSLWPNDYYFQLIVNHMLPKNCVVIADRRMFLITGNEAGVFLNFG